MTGDTEEIALHAALAVLPYPFTRDLDFPYAELVVRRSHSVLISAPIENQYSAM